MRILVTGGAGYLGSVLVRKLISEGHDIVVFDNLSTGYEEAVSTVPTVRFIEGDLSNIDDLKKLGPLIDFDAVVHLANFSDVVESLAKPYFYFKNNTVSTLNLLEFMKDKRIKKLVFASSASMYGDAKELPVAEDSPFDIKSPMAESKYMSEKLIGWFAYIHGIHAVALRLFEVGGAMESGAVGEYKVSLGLVSGFIKTAISEGVIRISGNSFETLDGTMERDFVHVEDVADAFNKALEFLQKNKKSEIFNICSGQKTSMKMLTYEIEAQLEKKIEVAFLQKKSGEITTLYGNNSKAVEELGWTPKHDLPAIIQTAIYWYVKYPSGLRQISL